MGGEAGFEWASQSGELRFMFAEYSIMVQQYFDNIIVGDGMKTVFAMVRIFHLADCNC